MLYEIYKMSKATETESKLAVGRGWGKGLMWNEYFNKYGASFGGDENVLELDIVAQHWEYTRYH